MDETVRRLTEGPKFSDLGQIEGKILNLFQALSETRARSLEQSNLVLAAWTKAVSEFTTKLSEAAATNKPFSSRSRNRFSLGGDWKSSPPRGPAFAAIPRNSACPVAGKFEP